MAHISEDRVFETTTSTGTGTLTLAGAIAGYRTFASVMATNDTCWYAVWGVDGAGAPTGEWEAGLGTYSATNTLTRTTVLESSNAGSVVTLSAGTKYVAITLIAGKTGQFDNVGALWMPAASAEPGTPATGSYLYAKAITPEHTGLKVKSPLGMDSFLQDALSFRRIAIARGGTAPLIVVPTNASGMAAPVSGTAVLPTPGTSIRNTTWRTQFATQNTANSINSAYSGQAQGLYVLRGSFNGEGGFRVVMRFSLSATQANNRFFAGLRDVQSAPVNVDPFTSTSPGVIGLAVNAATDANWRLVHNLTGSAPTNIALGSGFPVNNTDLIELALFCRPHNGTSAGNIGYRVRRFTTSITPTSEASGTLSTNLPAGATILYVGHWMVNVSTGIASFQVTSATVEADF